MNRPLRFPLGLIPGLVLAMAVPTAGAQFRLPLALSDGAVLHRDHPVPVWGWAAPDAEVEIAFDHADGGLATHDGAPLGGFAIADSDGQWHWAEAQIEGDRVVVWSPAVPEPVAPFSVVDL